MPSSFPMRFCLVLLALSLGACSQTPLDTSGPNVPTAAISADDVAQARARWQASGAASYTMRLERICFCDETWRGPFDVRVEEGEVVSVRLGRQSLPTERARSIASLFDLLDQALFSDAHRVEAAFDAQYGLPVRLSVDYDELIADEEVGYTITDVRLD